MPIDGVTGDVGASVGGVLGKTDGREVGAITGAGCRLGGKGSKGGDAGPAMLAGRTRPAQARAGIGR